MGEKAKIHNSRFKKKIFVYILYYGVIYTFLLYPYSIFKKNSIYFMRSV